MNPALRLAGTVAAALLAVHAHAATTAYTDSAAFLAALAADAYTDTFDGLDPATTPTVYTGGGKGFRYSISAPGGVYAGGTDMGTNQVDELLTITFTGNPVTAVGGNFYPTNFNPAFVARSITVALNDGTTRSYTPADMSSFLGFVSDTAIQSLTLGMTGANTTLYPTVDNLVVGTNAALVPEPGQWALVAASLAALALTTRRRAG